MYRSRKRHGAYQGTGKLYFGSKPTVKRLEFVVRIKDSTEGYKLAMRMQNAAARCENLPRSHITSSLVQMSESTRKLTNRRNVMATTMYFEETIHDQGSKATFDVELGRSSNYKEDSIYLTVDGKTVIMDRSTAKRFVEAVVAVGQYHGMID
jgi:TPR repeat protein